MTRRAWIGLVLVLVLAGLVGWQYWPAPAPDSATTPTAPSEAAPGTGLNPLAGRDPAALAAWAAHPLFAPERKPPVEPQTEPAPTLEVVAPLEVVPPAPEPDPQPVLQGVVTVPAPGGAFVSDGAGGPSVFLRPGQAAFGLSLEEVFEDRATFMTKDGEVTLTLPDAPPP